MPVRPECRPCPRPGSPEWKAARGSARWRRQARLAGSSTGCREARRVFSEPAERDRLTAQGANLALGSPEDYAAHIASELDRWGRVIRTAGIKSEL